MEQHARGPLLEGAASESELEETETPPEADAEAEAEFLARDRVRTVRTRLAVWAGGIARDLVPPQIWSEDRPSLEKQLAYARWAQWGPAEGPLRSAALAYCYVVALPTSVVAYLVEWVVERPTRLAAAALLIAALWWAWS